MASTIDQALVQLVAQKAIAGLTRDLAPLSGFCTNYSDEVSAFGTTVGVNVLGAPTAVKSATSAAVDYASDASGVVQKVNVTLNNRYRGVFDASDIDFGMINPGTLEAIIADQLLVAAGKLESDCWTTISGGAKDQNATTANTLTFANVNTASQTMSTDKLPRRGRALYLTPAALSSLISDDVVSKSFSTAIANDAVAEGKIGRLCGFDVFEAQSVADVAGVMGFACIPSTLAIAARPVMEENAIFCVQITAANGLPFVVKLISDPIHAKRYLVTETVAGVALLRSTNTEKRAIKLKAATA